jgi:hypothetical protein
MRVGGQWCLVPAQTPSGTIGWLLGSKRSTARVDQSNIPDIGFIWIGHHYLTDQHSPCPLAWKEWQFCVWRACRHNIHDITTYDGNTDIPWNIIHQLHIHMVDDLRRFYVAIINITIKILVKNLLLEHVNFLFLFGITYNFHNSNN